MKTISLKILLILSTILIVNSCAKNISGRKQLLLVSESSAISSSKTAYTDMLDPFKKEGKLDSDPDMVKRVNQITDKLIIEAKKLRKDTKNWEWSVKIIDDPKTINAWCMAGGKMAIYTGLINQLDATDDEIAQVMGHEISHALANHSAERMSIVMASGLALTTLKKTTDVSNTTLALSAVAAKLALTLPNSRLSESEADKIGIELAAKAGYNPNAAVSLWQKMAKASGSGGLEFLSTHPAPKNRQKTLKKLVPKMMPYYLKAKQ